MFDINFIPPATLTIFNRIVVDYQDHRDDTVEETAKAFGFVPDLQPCCCRHSASTLRPMKTSFAQPSWKPSNREHVFE